MTLSLQRKARTNIAERLKRYDIGEKCAKFTIDEVLPWYFSEFLDKTIDREEKKWFGERIFERGFGKPSQAVQVDQVSSGEQKVIYEIRWLPPDPNDHSKLIEQEPDAE